MKGLLFFLGYPELYFAEIVCHVQVQSRQFIRGYQWPHLSPADFLFSRPEKCFQPWGVPIRLLKRHRRIVLNSKDIQAKTAEQVPERSRKAEDSAARVLFPEPLIPRTIVIHRHQDNVSRFERIHLPGFRKMLPENDKIPPPSERKMNPAPLTWERVHVAKRFPKYFDEKSGRSCIDEVRLHTDKSRTRCLELRLHVSLPREKGLLRFSWRLTTDVEIFLATRWPKLLARHVPAQ